MKNISELRQDIVFGDWVVIATGRGRRPHDFAKKDGDHWWKRQKKNCPFDELIDSAFYVALKSGEVHKLSKKNKTVLEKNWFLQIIPNKYPAFGKGICAVQRKIGPYFWEDGVGFHDVIITRAHEKSVALMSQKEADILIRAYRDRYLQLKDEDCVEYVSIFHNHGPEAGASIAHPHSQVIAISVVPPDVGRSIKGSAVFYHKNKKCVHCVMIDFEKREKIRIIYENEKFVVFAPFASRTAFEVRVFPKKHSPNFESIHNSEITFLADALKMALAKLCKGLGNPSYNFFIHTSPAANIEALRHYHWHIEILPKTAIWAGFELGTGIDISSIAPEKAASFLRKIKN
ncbi:MAG: hypothetical protein A3G49_01730 [Candidatus Sungbacteria bacterium RIFCSPLOWO2_12_FULL_41_11]|uniref:DUF4921 domain-containing protein n=1 Tax=Candidatus Sungbacteria bacterium RIFCSPLOWO2_12_FULL_41_11 TaxID=1802286 RepID=A0A1G2LQN3_9BACT|nr:MAG: Galactose-1-phosphate uridylyltransferase [Parcubacteria group bacterium GW2011_GWA2_42_14]OGZ98416.1 MAG: hypothetical protein A3D41_01580 [Candidatus Sungbacteria bacterium RIFCSPHIGHO2_02_FULL_41_12b]OHA13940.1 MAG: hypothetical protein A3G49_01730 [Candidatus Sungbacteria bacterium RIFCSPLOWO2_12_FULL_41_11]